MFGSASPAVVPVLAAALVLALAPANLAQDSTGSSSDEPLHIDKMEKETVRLVLVDVMVLDKENRTVPGLTIADFEVHHDGRLVALDTLDTHCEGSHPEPEAIRFARERVPQPATTNGRRIVLALDYQHLGFNVRNEVFDQVRQWLLKDMASGDEVMLVALTGGLRVEQALTADREAALRSLQRMEHDITLWNGSFEHINEIGWVTGVTALLDVIEQTPGRKALVLFSSMDDSPFDSQFDRIAAQAAASRCAIYPVDTGGLARGMPGGIRLGDGRRDRGARQAGGAFAPSSSAPLARLAIESGGRLTERTNDFALGLVRAQRDLGCGYVLGFYIDDAVDDKITRIAVDALRPGLKAIHGSKYVFRTDSVKRESKLLAAWAAPEQFDSGVVQAHAFPLRPASKGAWEALLTVSFPIPLDLLTQGHQTREFGALLLDGQQVVHRFQKRLTVQPENTNIDGLPRMTFIEPLVLEPGRYTLKVVMSDPRSATLHATKTLIDVPEVPRGGPFLVGPILARRAGPNLVVFSNDDGEDRAGNARTFEPMLVQMVDEPQDLVALTQACVVGKTKAPKTSVSRTLSWLYGRRIGTLDPVPLELEGNDTVRCQSLLDVLPEAALGAGGEYVFEARFGDTGDDETSAGRVRFAVGNVLDPP